jgi:hypothetical protein
MRKLLIVVALLALPSAGWAQGARGYAEDSPALEGDHVTLAGCVRSDSGTGTTDTDGDRAAVVCNENGWVYIVGQTNAVQSGDWVVTLGGTPTVNVGNGSLTDTNSLAMTATGASALATIAGSDCAIVSAASTNATNCKASAGNLYGYEIFNTTTTVYYLRLYNLASAPTCSSATGWVRSIPIPPAGAAGQVGGVVTPLSFPINYGTGIGYCITGGATSTDNTNAAAGIYGALKFK